MFMSMYNFKKVPLSEHDKLVKFIDEHWKKNHALVMSDSLLKFQHFSEVDNCYNFIVAQDEESDEYDAIVGYIPVYQYDSTLKCNGDYWGAIWKYREDSVNPNINAAALYIWKKLFKLPNFQSYAAIGISDIAKKIYEVYRMKLGYLSQYYIMNDCYDKYLIACNVPKLQNNTKEIDNNYEVKFVEFSDDLKNIRPYYRPYKSIEYFRKRFVEHPVYNYKFIAVFEKGVILSIWACRIVKAKGSKVIRVMDVIGKLDGYIYPQILKLLYDHECEYLDIMNYGIDENVFLNMGFQKLDVNGSLILPNYFEPFEQRNVRIGLAYKANYSNYVAFKGDSDQDRPNIINSNDD